MEIETIVISNFATGPSTIYQNGDIRSGRSYLQVSGGYNPYQWPGSLSWASPVVQIDAAGAVITDLVLAGKTRIESGITYVYAIGNAARLYKIQVNDPTTYNPDYDNPVLIATLAAETPTFTRGGSIEFYGSTEQIFIGHDKGITRINFDGTGETFVGSTSSWVQNVPRPIEQFVGKLYIGNGPNLAEIDTTLLVTTYTKLSPGFPSNSQARDIDTTPDGNYLQSVVNRTPLPDITSAAQDTTTSSPSESYLFGWNGTDTGYTQFITYPGVSLNANTLFQNNQYVVGSDMSGLSTSNPTDRIMQAPEQQPVLPNAITNVGGVLFYISPLIFDGVLEADLYTWGAFDYEQGVPYGYNDIMFFNSSGAETDVALVPLLLPVSNVGFGSSTNGYTGNQYGTSKLYVSALETSETTSVPKLYKWRPVFSPLDTDGSAVVGGVYQTQTQLFSKKMNIKQVRVYAHPWVADNEFTIDLIGSSGEPMTNGSKTFTAQNSSATSPMYIGTDYAWWDPQIAPTYALAILLTNLGTANHVITKIEIDVTPAGI